MKTRLVVSILGVVVLSTGACACNPKHTPHDPDPIDDGPSPLPVPSPSGPQTELLLVTLNLRAVCDVAGVDYRARFRRFADWFKDHELPAPDIIALQELQAWEWCSYDWDEVKDYETTNALLAALASAYPQTRYRLAYAEAPGCTAGHCFSKDCPPLTDGLCHGIGGNGLLYNASTLEHLAEAGPGLPFDSIASGKANVWRSLPCCNPREGESCPPLDGPMNTEKCGIETAAGYVWSLGPGDLSFSRFRVRSLGMLLHLYNVHSRKPVLDGDGHAFLVETEQRFAKDELVAPVIVMGDFNWAALEVWPTEFDVIPPLPGIDAILVGKRDVWRSSGRYEACAPDLPCGGAPPWEANPDDAENLFSDHEGPDAHYATLRLTGHLRPCAATSEEPCEDGDGVDWDDDNCPREYNPGQENGDASSPQPDELGDACDEDRDGDGRTNASDDCPDVYDPDQANSDQSMLADALGDVCDPDDDGDCVDDDADACSLVPGCTADVARGACAPCQIPQIDGSILRGAVHACLGSISDRCFDECCGVGPLGAIGPLLKGAPHDLLASAGIRAQGAKLCLPARPVRVPTTISCELAVRNLQGRLGGMSWDDVATCKRKRAEAKAACARCP